MSSQTTMTAPRRILLVKPSSLGDVLHALPVVSAIHRHWPDAQLRWLIHPAWRSLVEGHPGVSGTVLFPRDKFRGPSGWLRSLAWLRVLRDWKPDLAIDLQGLMRSALFARISGAARIVGLSDAREGSRLLLNKAAQVDPRAHAVCRYLAVLAPLGISGPEEPEFLLPAGTLPPGFDRSSPYIVLHPYARGEGKSLSPAMIRAFFRGTGPRRVVLVGRGETIGGLPPHVEDWSNRTNLLELTAILRNARFTVSSDSGPMHLAAALCPERTLAIHFWSDPLMVGPYGPGALVWKGGRLGCAGTLDASWRPPSAGPSEGEMESLGRLVAEEAEREEPGFPVSPQGF